MSTSPAAIVADQTIDLSACEPRIRDQLLEWYSELAAVAAEIDDRVSRARAAERIAELTEGVR